MAYLSAALLLSVGILLGSFPLNALAAGIGTTSSRMLIPRLVINRSSKDNGGSLSYTGAEVPNFILLHELNPLLLIFVMHYMIAFLVVIIVIVMPVILLFLYSLVSYFFSIVNLTLKVIMN